MKALIKVTITSPANMQEVLSKYSTLRMYLDSFNRISPNEFISNGNVEIDPTTGKYTLVKDSLDFKKSLLDWGFNERMWYTGDNEDGSPHFDEGDALLFYNEYPEGFKWNLSLLCTLK